MVRVGKGLCVSRVFSHDGKTQISDIYSLLTHARLYYTIVRMKEWLIPLINEAYGTSIDEDAEVVLHENEQMILTSIDADDLEQQGIPRKITDTTVTIGNCSYHLECQSGEDGTDTDSTQADHTEAVRRRKGKDREHDGWKSIRDVFR